MATAFVAGLCLATILTLLVVPVLYLLLHRLAHGRGDEAPEVGEDPSKGYTPS
jgi:hypothetical protein